MKVTYEQLREAAGDIAAVVDYDIWKEAFLYDEEEQGHDIEITGALIQQIRKLGFDLEVIHE
jgi:hypothetical protein